MVEMLNKDDGSIELLKKEVMNHITLTLDSIDANDETSNRLYEEIRKAESELKKISKKNNTTTIQCYQGLRDIYFEQYMNMRTHAAKVKIFSEDWYYYEKCAKFYLILSNIPTILLTEEHILAIVRGTAGKIH